MDDSVRRELLEANLSRQLGWIAAADAKTGFVFAVDTAMLGLLAAAAPAYGKWTPPGVIAAIAATAALVVSLACLSVAVFPRTRGPRLSDIFFGSIAARTVDQFRSDVLRLDESVYLEDLVQQCHINAQIASKKYAWIKAASIALYVSLAPWVLATYILFRDK